MSAKPNRRIPLSEQCWVNAAVEMIKKKGIGAIHVTKLARILKVSRGSFYWHFKDRDALLYALICEWKRRNSQPIFDAIHNTKSLTLGMVDLFSVWIKTDLFDSRLDQSIRDWGYNDPAIAQTVKTEDEKRIAAIAQLFEYYNFSKTDAFIRARTLYFAQLCYHYLGVDETFEQRIENIPSYFLCFTDETIDQETKEAFIRLISEVTTK